MPHQELMNKNTERWLIRLTEFLDELPFGTVISTTCGFASKGEKIYFGADGFLGSRKVWSCSCGESKSSMDVAKNHGGEHEIIVFENQELVEWDEDGDGDERLLQKKLEEMDSGTVVSTDCGYAIKNPDWDDGFDSVEETREQVDWTCSCGTTKPSMWLADEIGPYDLFSFKTERVIDWFTEETQEDQEEKMSDASIPVVKIQELIEGYGQMNLELGSSIGEQARKKINKSLISDLQELLPKKTMEGVEWDGREHHLAEAVADWIDVEPYEVVMIEPRSGASNIKVWNPRTNEYRDVDSSALILTGRKYKLAPDNSEEIVKVIRHEKELCIDNQDFSRAMLWRNMERAAGQGEWKDLLNSIRELKLPKDSDSTSVNGAVTDDSPLSERLDSLFGYDPAGEDHVHWAPEGGMSTEYGVQVAGYPTALAGWRDWAEEPVNAMEWFPDRDERDDFGTHREDEGYEVEYFTRLVTNPIKDEMEHIQ